MYLVKAIDTINLKYLKYLFMVCRPICNHPGQEDNFEMKGFLASKPLYVALRLVVGLLFVYAGALKLMDTNTFAVSIDAYGLVPWWVAKKLSYVLPMIEILAGIGTILDIRGALGMIVAQLLVFMAVLAYAHHLGLDVDCGCFGPSEGDAVHSGPGEALIRDMLLFGACLAMYWQRRAAGYLPRPRVKRHP